MAFDYDSYLSPFTWRYSSKEMRCLFSERHRREQLRRVWLAIATAQAKAGLVNRQELEDIRNHVKDVEIEKALEIEREIKHDLMSELKVFSSQCEIGGGKLHLGATSMDIEDNADVLIQREALEEVEKKIVLLLKALKKKILQYKSLRCMAFTHLQPAEPTTLGYRFCVYAQDFLTCLRHVRGLKDSLKGKGFKGAVGTSASYYELLEGKVKVEAFEESALKELSLNAFTVSTQTYPREQDFEITCCLSSCALSLSKLAFDIRLLQNPLVGEVSEPFSSKQVGSSAMPFKRNPISCEKVCSLARIVQSSLSVSWENAANSLLERTLDDSANRRIFLPQSFLAVDEMLLYMIKVIEGLVVDEEAVRRNFNYFAPFSATELVLMEYSKKGGDRQKGHELIRELSMKAWSEVKGGKANPLLTLITNEKEFSKIGEKELKKLFDRVSGHVGNAEEKCEVMSKTIEKECG